jgi:hypothetical protein
VLQTALIEARVAVVRESITKAIGRSSRPGLRDINDHRSVGSVCHRHVTQLYVVRVHITFTSVS